MDFILSILHKGTIGTIKKYPAFKRVYIGLAIAAIFEQLLTILVLRVFITHRVVPDTYFVLIFALIMALVVGIYEHVKEAPMRANIASWNKLFQDMKLNMGDHQPYFLYKKAISQYAIEIAFKTIIPLNVWQAKKEIIAMNINKKILTIKQDERDNQIIKLIIEGEPLTSNISWDDDYTSSRDTLNIGMGYLGVVGMDLTHHPHAFVAGKPGSGKSNILKCLIHQAISKGYEVTIIDFKRGVSFSRFRDYVKAHYDYEPAIKALQAMVKETNNRLDLFRENDVDNINDYNRITSDYLKRKIIFIDELAELLQTGDKKLSDLINDNIATLTRLSRATGIHLIMGIQRPDATLVQGQIKSNVSFRICGKFTDREPSQIMLSSDAASKLADIEGRFIIKDDEMQEVQCFYYDALTMKPKTPVAKPRFNPFMDSGTASSDTEPANTASAEPKPKKPASDFKFDFSEFLK